MGRHKKKKKDLEESLSTYVLEKHGDLFLKNMEFLSKVIGSSTRES